MKDCKKRAACLVYREPAEIAVTLAEMDTWNSRAEGIALSNNNMVFYKASVIKNYWGVARY